MPSHLFVAVATPPAEENHHPTPPPLRAALSRAGFEVLTAKDGKEALARIDSIQPDLIILDVMMPEMDGYEVCRRLRSHQRSSVPVCRRDVGCALQCDGMSSLGGPA